MTSPDRQPACCEHGIEHHGQERDFYETPSRREVCLMCPGYVDTNDQPFYPRGKAWHRYRPAPEVQS